MLRAKGRPDIRLALRPGRASDGNALQSYVRGLSPQSRYNRFLGGASELPASELARAFAANGRDTLTLLLTSAVEDRETVVGEARVALSCAKRAGEFGMSITDDWQHIGAGTALLKEIERRAEVDGIELLFGDTLRTNDGMIGLARGRGFHLEPGFEPRLVRIHKWLDAADDLPCRKWKEIVGGAGLGTASAPRGVKNLAMLTHLSLLARLANAAATVCCAHPGRLSGAILTTPRLASRVVRISGEHRV